MPGPDLRPTLTCAIPGLVWPAALAPAELPALPGLARLLASARLAHAAPVAPEDWLAQAFGLEGSMPFAALRLAGRGHAADDSARLLCADPASLRFAREHLVLDGPEQVTASREELDALFTSLNAEFNDIGHFHHLDGEGYLSLAAAHADKLAVELAPLSAVTGRPVSHFQPEGPQAAWWARLANELQIVCHNHPVNQAREARGAPLLNTLWLWGAGPAPTALRAPAARIRGEGILLRGLAHYAGCELVDDAHAAWQWINALEAPARARDQQGWSTALAALDDSVFKLLADLLQSGLSIQLVAPSDTTLSTFTLQAVPRWKFWQGPASTTLLASLLSNPA